MSADGLAERSGAPRVGRQDAGTPRSRWRRRGYREAAAFAIAFDIWKQLKAVLTERCGCAFKRNHKSQAAQIAGIRARLVSTSAHVVAAMTVHQAKGQEWDTVSLILTEAQEVRLTDGLRLTKLTASCTSQRPAPATSSSCEH